MGAADRSHSHYPATPRRRAVRQVMCRFPPVTKRCRLEGGGLVAATPQNTERSTVAGGAKRSRSMPSRVVPPIELPASVDELARVAAAQLGWNGIVLPETTILGRKVCVVAKLRTDVHAERIAMGASPVADRATVDTWTWPELAGTAPPPAAELFCV